jgi:hypothetical protein
VKFLKLVLARSVIHCADGVCDLPKDTARRVAALQRELDNT